MRAKITSLLLGCVGVFIFSGCDTDVEALDIQTLKTYDEQYFQNIRDFKKSDQAPVVFHHCLGSGPYACNQFLWIITVFRAFLADCPKISLHKIL